ncbi:hypothetical protein PpBr36_01511 [Pyricularia pennisetigena]|uniref:hypothetical protein n=1 Tax=Pyricularia pennisetigena TaxID=1578925 RepID=UPI0011502A43|nr:hypothetical protein PpBr36_01511 [Pyricularia pennisetigena]TLS29501.1 hypothetical protein PpBr36_01511 [Pyricularia pennisetigena]
MANSSPPTRLQRDVRPSSANRLSYPWGANVDFDLEQLTLEDRNSEESHRRGLAHARQFHANLRKTAVDVLNQYHLQEEQQRVKLEQEREEARLRAEAQLAAERQRLEALKAKTIPVPSPPTTKPEPEPPKATEEVPKPQAPRPSANGQTSQAPTGSQKQPDLNGSKSSTTQKPASALFGSIQGNTQPFQPQSTAIKEPANAQTQPNIPINTPDPTTADSRPSPAVEVPKSDRYVEVHRNLKQLRTFMEQQRGKNPQLKKNMGDMRRFIRVKIGQLTPGANKEQAEDIKKKLREALSGQIPSEPEDPNKFLLQPRNPVEGVQNNSPYLPSLYLYLLNVFAKAVIAQFVNECGAKPQAADPIGTLVAKVFADPEFHWRGGSMIDILLAKFRVSCPVLFGFRGNDKTEQGRLRVGWRKDKGGSWDAEQTHVDRMTGLGAGFAAIALRDFARVKLKNPYPPSNYWTALARIINTPANEISDTQCYVLKAMIENHEKRFIQFYGTAAVAALRVALVEFPAKVQKKSAAVSALPVLAQILKRDTGLNLL